MAATQLTVSAAEAARVVEGMMRRQRTQRRLPTLSKIEQDISEKTCVHIYNVGPWEFTRSLGSWGTFHIPKCEDPKTYARMKTPIPGIFTEPIPVSETKFDLEHIEGRYVAEQIVGTGKHLSPKESLLRYGVFIGSNVGPDAKPTDAELTAAFARLKETYLELLKEATLAHNKGPKEAEQVIGDNHRLAAVKLNRLDVEWLKQYSPEARQNCPMCGTASAQGVVVCPQCRYIFDTKRYEQMAGRIAKG